MNWNGNVNMQLISAEQQRYPTVGDWWIDEAGCLQVRATLLSNIMDSHLVMAHEYVEAMLCIHYGVTVEAVDKFDTEWKNDGVYAEPGDDPTAPYHEQHDIALIVERMLAHACGVDWTKHDNAIEASFKAMNK